MQNYIYRDFRDFLLNEIEKIEISKKSKTGSIYDLLDLPVLSYHSVIVKLGRILEKSYKYISYKYGKQLSETEKKLPYQIDLLFEKNNRIYYFESKLSLKFDSEKRSKIVNKINHIKNILSYYYTDKEIVCKLLTSRYDFSKNIKSSSIPKNMIYGYTDFFYLFDTIVDSIKWQKLFNEISNILSKKILKSILNKNNELF